MEGVSGRDTPFEVVLTSLSRIMIMWPFRKIASLRESGMFKGFTDWHSHILPGVDDGFKKLEDSLRMLSIYEKEGMKRVWLTPHIMEDYPNTPEKLRTRFEELKLAYTGPIELRLAAEHMLDSLFQERIEKGEVLPIGENGEFLLVETSYINPPFGMEEMLESVVSHGLRPLLAHPERYRYMEENDYYRLKDQGVLFQTNFVSLVDGYGDQARKKAEWLLKEGLVDVTGSDVHRVEFFERFAGESARKKQSVEALTALAQSPKIY